MNRGQVVGWGLIGGGLLLVLSTPLFFAYSGWAQAQLMASANHLLQKEAKTRAVSTKTVARKQIPLKRGSVLGKISIPSLSLQAAFVQGTSETQLATAPGHLSTSVMPGLVGTSIIAAHNVTFFRHINRLKTGDIVKVQTQKGQFQFQVTGHEVVNIKTGVVPNTTYASLALEACYPLNALYLTPYRYIVFAKEIGKNVQGMNVPTKIKTERLTNIPQSFLQKDHLTVPMGTLSYIIAGKKTAADTAFEQSAVPYAYMRAWIHLWTAALLAKRQMFSSFAKKGTVDPFLGVKTVSYHSFLDLRITLDRKGHVQSILGNFAHLNIFGPQGQKTGWAMMMASPGANGKLQISSYRDQLH